MKCGLDRVSVQLLPDLIDTAVIRIRFDNVTIDVDVLDRLERRGRLGGQLLRAYNAAHPPIPAAIPSQPIEMRLHKLHVNMPPNEHASQHTMPPPLQPPNEQMTATSAYIYEPPDAFDGATTVVCDNEVANVFGVSCS